jgi:hypothetical protein
MKALDITQHGSQHTLFNVLIVIIIYMLEGGYTPENIKNATASIIDILINN